MRAYAASWLVLLRPLLLLIVSCSLFIAGGCTREPWHFPLALPAQAPDTLVVGEGPASTPILWGQGKIKARTVIIQAGAGNVASPANKVKADAAASGAGSTASATDTGLPWWVYLLLVGIGAALYAYVRSLIPRIRPG